MSTPQPGWYPDPQNPRSRLRFFDGARWTEHERDFPGQVSQAGIAGRAGPGSQPNWFARHKVLTSIIGVAVLVFVIAGVAGGLAEDTDGEGSPASSTAADEPAGPDSGGDKTAEASADEEKPDKGNRDKSDRDKNDQDAAKPGEDEPETDREPARTHTVARVVDGDTLELADGRSVRLVGIDTPERGECGYDEATASLERLVGGQQVRLTRTGENADRYGRLLRYVDAGNTDAGLRQIRQGFAIARYDSRDGYGHHPREETYIEADENTSEQFSCPEPTPTQEAEPEPTPTESNCMAGYSPCIPVAPDLDCGEIGFAVHVTGSDPYRLDADGDGVGCDS